MQFKQIRTDVFVQFNFIFSNYLQHICIIFHGILYMQPPITDGKIYKSNKFVKNHKIFHVFLI